MSYNEFNKSTLRRFAYVAMAVLFIVAINISLIWRSRYIAIRDHDGDFSLMVSERGLYGVLCRYTPKSQSRWLKSKHAISCPLFQAERISLAVKSDDQLGCLLRFPELRKLMLVGQFTDAAVDILVQMRSLEDLTIYSQHFPNISITPHPSECTQHLSDDGLGRLGDLPELHRLGVESPLITGSGFKAFKNTSTLTWLEIHRSEEFRDDGLLELSRFTNLEVIWIGTSVFLDGYGLDVTNELPKLRMVMGVEEAFILPEYKTLFQETERKYRLK